MKFATTIDGDNYTLIGRDGFIVSHGVEVQDCGDVIRVNGTTHRKDEIEIAEDGTITLLASGSALSR